MVIISNPISKEQLHAMLGTYFDDMIKGVVDLGRNTIALDAELHADLESFLLSEGSLQENLWGINLYPDMEGEDFLEYDSIINIRPYQDNPGRDVYNPETRNLIKELVNKLIQ